MCYNPSKTRVHVVSCGRGSTCRRICQLCRCKASLCPCSCWPCSWRWSSWHCRQNWPWSIPCSTAGPPWEVQDKQRPKSITDVGQRLPTQGSHLPPPTATQLVSPGQALPARALLVGAAGGMSIHHLHKAFKCNNADSSEGWASCNWYWQGRRRKEQYLGQPGPRAALLLGDPVSLGRQQLIVDVAGPLFLCVCVLGPEALTHLVSQALLNGGMPEHPDDKVDLGEVLEHVPVELGHAPLKVVTKERPGLHPHEHIGHQREPRGRPNTVMPHRVCTA